jgi:hypothetical protein
MSENPLLGEGYLNLSASLNRQYTESKPASMSAMPGIWLFDCGGTSHLLLSAAGVSFEDARIEATIDYVI